MYEADPHCERNQSQPIRLRKAMKDAKSFNLKKLGSLLKQSSGGLQMNCWQSADDDWRTLY